MKLAWPRPFSAGSTAATTTCTSAMPPLVIHALVPFSTHSSVGLVVDGPGAQRRHVAAGVGLAHAERAELHFVRGAVALRHPLDDLLGRAVAGDAGGGERRAHDRHADAGVTPEQLLDGDRQGQPGRVGERVQQEVEAVEAVLRGLLHDRPRELLTLVPLVGGGTHDVVGELVHPLLDLQLVFVEVQREVGHAPKLPLGNKTWQREPSVSTSERNARSDRPARWMTWFTAIRVLQSTEFFGLGRRVGRRHTGRHAATDRAGRARGYPIPTLSSNR